MTKAEYNNTLDRMEREILEAFERKDLTTYNNLLAEIVTVWEKGTELGYDDGSRDCSTLETDYSEGYFEDWEYQF